MAALCVTIVIAVTGWLIISRNQPAAIATVTFDKVGIWPGRIASQKHPDATNGFAIAFKGAKLVNTGSKSLYVQRLELEVQIDGQWRMGRHFIPQFFNATNSIGLPDRGVHLLLEKPGKPKTTIVDDGWKELSEEKPLQPNEPEWISYAARFNGPLEDFQKCQAIKLTVVDFSERRFEQLIPVKDLAKVKARAPYTTVVADGRIFEPEMGIPFKVLEMDTNWPND